MPRPGKSSKTGDESYWRIRRGKPVKIPLKWVGHTTHPQKIRKRKQQQRDKKKEDYRMKGRPPTPPDPKEWDF